MFTLGMKNREERSKHFFDSGPLMEEDEELAIYDKVPTLTSSRIHSVLLRHLAIKHMKYNNPIKYICDDKK